MLVSLLSKENIIKQRHYRRYAEKGHMHSARKIGRNWVVELEEPYPVAKRPKAAPQYFDITFQRMRRHGHGVSRRFRLSRQTTMLKTGDIIWAERNRQGCLQHIQANLGDIVGRHLWEQSDNYLNMQTL